MEDIGVVVTPIILHIEQSKSGESAFSNTRSLKLTAILQVARDGIALANDHLIPGIAPLVALKAVPMVGTPTGAIINLNDLTHQGTYIFSH